MFYHSESACEGEAIELPSRQPRSDGVQDFIEKIMPGATKEKQDTKVSRRQSSLRD